MRAKCSEYTERHDEKCVQWNLKWNALVLVHEGDIVTVTEGVLPSNYYYTIDPSLAMSGNVPFRERLMARSGKVLSVVENERGFYVTVEFDEK